VPLPRRAALVALAAAAACRCGPGDGPGAGPRIWVGAVDAVRVDAIEPHGARTTVATAPALDAPVRVLLPLSDRNVLALQEAEACDGGTFDPSDACTPAAASRPLAPGVVLDREGHRVRALAALDGHGAPLFTWKQPPWAATQDPSGRIWVTGRTAPVVYGETGAFALDPELVATLPYATRGAAALADGRVLVSYGPQDLAIYAADGTLTEQLAPALGADYEGIDGLLALPGGNLLLGTSRWFGVTSAGVVLEGRLDPGGVLTLLVDPSLCATVGEGIPSALARVPGAFITAPSLVRLFPPDCGRWLSPDLAADHGCIAPEPHRGVAWVE
jgi:hypothetical protein